MSARATNDTNPFEHLVIPRITDFRMRNEGADIAIQDVYAAQVADTARDELITQDLIRAVQQGRSPLVLTGRTEHFAHFEAKLSGIVKNVFVLKDFAPLKAAKKQTRSQIEPPDLRRRLHLAVQPYNRFVKWLRHESPCPI
jgi:hypothetical protein